MSVASFDSWDLGQSFEFKREERSAYVALAQPPEGYRFVRHDLTFDGVDGVFTNAPFKGPEGKKVYDDGATVIAVAEDGDIVRVPYKRVVQARWVSEWGTA